MSKFLFPLAPTEDEHSFKNSHRNPRRVFRPSTPPRRSPIQSHGWRARLGAPGALVEAALEAAPHRRQDPVPGVDVQAVGRGTGTSAVGWAGGEVKGAGFEEEEFEGHGYCIDFGWENVPP